jgi:hypothetical protein
MNPGETVNRSLAFLLSASGTVILAITVVGCGNNDEPAPPGHRLSAEAPSQKAAVPARRADEAKPAFSATDKYKTIENQESGDFF